MLGTSNSIVRWLKEAGATATSGGSAATWRRAVIAAQVGAVFLLLTTAGLMLTSFWRLSRVDAGYDGREVLTMEIRALGVPDDRLARVQREILEAVQAVPGVTQAAMTSAVPLRGTDWLRRIALPSTSGAGGTTAANIREVSPEYQAVMRIPLLAGRWLNARDDVKAPKVAVVSRSLAMAIAPDARVLGQHIEVGSSRVEIVGVVGDVHAEALVTDPRPAIYVPRAQDPSELMCLVMRTSAPNVASVVASVRAAIHQIAPEQPVERVTTLDEIASQSIADRRFVTATTTAFAAAALILAVVGLAGVVSRSVAERTREIAVRVALGADGGRLRRMIVGDALRPVVLGAAFGVLASWWATALLAVVALIAAYLPARASTKIDPIVALRAQ
jgi:predicted permease